MAKFAKIVDGEVINIAVWNEAPDDTWVAHEPGVEIGDLYDGETFTKPEPVVDVPQSVTRRQARQALFLAGKLEDAETAINAIPDATQRGLALIYWNDSLTFERDHPLIGAIGAAIDLDDAQIDDLFVVGKSLP